MNMTFLSKFKNTHSLSMNSFFTSTPTLNARWLWLSSINIKCLNLTQKMNTSTALALSAPNNLPIPIIGTGSTAHGLGKGANLCGIMRKNLNICVVHYHLLQLAQYERSATIFGTLLKNRQGLIPADSFYFMILSQSVPPR